MQEAGLQPRFIQGRRYTDEATRDIVERLSMFAGSIIKLERLALNMEQVEEYGPPPNPAK